MGEKEFIVLKKVAGKLYLWLCTESTLLGIRSTKLYIFCLAV